MAYIRWVEDQVETTEVFGSRWGTLFSGDEEESSPLAKMLSEDSVLLSMFRNVEYRGRKKVPYPQVVKGANHDLAGFLLPVNLGLTHRLRLSNVGRNAQKKECEDAQNEFAE